MPQARRCTELLLVIDDLVRRNAAHDHLVKLLRLDSPVRDEYRLPDYALDVVVQLIFAPVIGSLKRYKLLYKRFPEELTGNRLALYRDNRHPLIGQNAVIVQLLAYDDRHPAVRELLCRRLIEGNDVFAPVDPLGLCRHDCGREGVKPVASRTGYGRHHIPVAGSPLDPQPVKVVYRPGIKHLIGDDVSLLVDRLLVHRLREHLIWREYPAHKVALAYVPRAAGLLLHRPDKPPGMSVPPRQHKSRPGKLRPSVNAVFQAVPVYVALSVP